MSPSLISGGAEQNNKDIKIKKVFKNKQYENYWPLSGILKLDFHMVLTLVFIIKNMTQKIINEENAELRSKLPSGVCLTHSAIFNFPPGKFLVTTNQGTGVSTWTI